MAVGGIERCVANLANGLDTGRFRPVVICMSTSGAGAEWIQRADVPIIELKKRQGNDVQAVFHLRRVLIRERVQVVHSHNWGPLIETSVARRLAGVPCHVHTEHGQGLHGPGSRLKQRLRRAATRWAFHRATTVTVCARNVVPQVIARTGFQRLQFVPNGVSLGAARSDSARIDIRNSLGIPASASVVGSVGRFAAVKDFANAIQALARMIRGGFSGHLVLVGDGPEMPHLRELTRKLALDGRVHLVGQQNNVGDWLSCFDVFVNSSVSEAMSLGILEAMSAGLPIVATNVGDNADLVAGQPPCGLIVEPRQPERLADALADVLGDADRRQRYSRAAAQRYRESYSVSAMVERYQAIYEAGLSGTLNGKK